jgi:hypothetical protein
VGSWVYDESGIEIPADQQEFEMYRNPRGKLSCQGKISYKGPVSPTRPLPRIKLDLTADEHNRLAAGDRRNFSPALTMLSALTRTRGWAARCRPTCAGRLGGAAAAGLHDGEVAGGAVADSFFRIVVRRFEG